MELAQTALGLALLTGLTGCMSPPPPTGFLKDYSRLEKVEHGWMRYVDPKLANYDSYIVDPVEIHVRREVLDEAKRADIARYMHNALVGVLRSRNVRLVTEAGVKTARLRVAITDIQESKWYLNIHPATKLTGVGRAGASMEAEVIDSVNGEQLAAAIRAGQGRQFELNPFSTIDDVKNVIDRWAEAAGQRLDELRAHKTQ